MDTFGVSRGTSRCVRPDPFNLPARIDYQGTVRAGYIPQTAVIADKVVVIRRMTGAGVPLYVTVPLAAYSGVVLTSDADGEGVALRLDHPNRDLAIPLYRSGDADDVIAEWQAWGRTLRRPILIEDADGEVRDPHERIGMLIVHRPKARRLNRFFADRRPRVLMNRKLGGRPSGLVHRDDEIIARDTTD